MSEERYAAAEVREREAAARVPKVSLVGAGPGDPELLTVKAARVLANAQTVLYDHLVSPAVLELIPPSAERIYVGKESACHSLPQDEIVALMLRLVRERGSIVRLKGGDPYVFGRGGEEAQALAAAGIAFEVIPGISAAQGAAACAGIPLTHRDHAPGLTFVTGHLREDSQEPLDWSALARMRQTLVVYMGVATLQVVSQRLIEHGRSADTPAAVVERATLPDQRTIVGTLATLPGLCLRAAVKPPAVIIVGTVVDLHRELGGAGREAQALTCAA